MFTFENEIAMNDIDDGINPRSLPHPLSLVWEKFWAESWNRILPDSGRVHSIMIPRKSSSKVRCNDIGLV